MVTILLGAVTAFIITATLIPVIIRVSKIKGLHDLPDERKIHRKPVSALGGIAIFAGVIGSCLGFFPFSIGPELQYFVLAALILFFTGLKDDLVVISPTTKFAAQFLAALVMVLQGDLCITNFHGLFGIYELPWLFSIILTLVVTVYVINAFNLVDGIDGLAGTLGLVSAAVFGIFFLMNDVEVYSFISFVLVGALAGFLLYNIAPAKIFMGDTGALLVGLIVAMLFIKFLDKTLVKNFQNLVPNPSLALSIICIPMLDAFRVFCYRIAQGRSPFFPDRNHIHHILIDKGWSHRNITSLLSSVSILMVLLVSFCQDININFLVPGIFLLFYLFVFLLRQLPQRSANAVNDKVVSV